MGFANLCIRVELPTFNLVMPSFRQASFLRRAIDSVRAQEGVRVTLDVRDAGSDDGTVAILRSYGTTLAWRSGPDAGQAAAINAGLQASSGEICGYLNSDDLLLPGALRRVGELFATRPEIDVVYGRAWFVDETDAPVREYPSIPFDFATLVEHCFLCQPATFWRRSVHARFGWFDASFDNCFDYEFWLRLAVGGAKFTHLPEFLAGSREHPATKSQRNRGRIFAEIRRMELRHLGYCARNWWEQQLRYWRDESCVWAGRLLPGRHDDRLYRIAWWPYVLWRRRLGGPLFYRPGHWRA